MPEFVSTRRSVIRTVAWSVPAVTVAAATPAFARSTTPVPAPNLSTSASGGTPTRNGDVVTIPASTLKNSGSVDATGVVIRFQTSEVVGQLQLEFFGTPYDPSTFGGVVAGLPGKDFTLTVAATLVPKNGEYPSPVNQVLTFATGSASSSTLQVTVTAVNGGTSWTPAQITV